MKVISVVGTKKSGNTTLVTRLSGRSGVMGLLGR